MSKLDYDLLPPHLREGMRRYFEDGIETGSFLRAVLEGDIHGAYRRGDPISIAEMVHVIEFMDGLPPEAWGSPAKVQAWIDKHAKERSER